MRHPFQREESPAEIAEVNVVPLADVSLVLLIILLVLSPLMAQSMLHVRTAAKEREAPSAEEPPPPGLPELVLVVDLGPGGVAVGDTLFGSPAELTAYLRAELPRRSDRKVFLAPHPDVTHGTVVSIIEAIQSAGASSVALVQSVTPPPAGAENARPPRTAPPEAP